MGMHISKFKVFVFGLIIFSGLSFPSPAASDDSSLRTLNELFPGLASDQMGMVLSDTGLKNVFSKNEKPLFVPASNSGVNLLSSIMEKTPTVLVEALFMVPYNNRQLNKLDAYNAIGKIRNISSYLVYSPSREKHVPLFEESTRLENANRNRPIPDPPSAAMLPSTETMYVCLKDTFFGNTYFRGDFSEGRYGITYNMANNTAIRFLIFPVMPAEKFAAILYLEPLVEGMLIYGVAGIDVPEFLTSRVNLALQIDRRVTVLINWLSDSLKSIS